MQDKVPEPISRPVQPTVPAGNVPPTSSSPSATINSTPMGMPVANVGRPSKGKAVLVSLLILVLIGSTAAFGYLWWQARSAQAQVAQAKSDKETAEKKLAQAEAKVSELEKTSQAVVETPKKTDDELITEVTKQYSSTIVSRDASKLTYDKPTISTKDKSFATVKFAEKDSMERMIYILKKVNEDWVVVAMGDDGQISSEVRTQFGIPADIK